MPSTQNPDTIRTAYDLACEEYARKYADELDHKPDDRVRLTEFAARVGAGGPVLDLGCGPGHTTAHLTGLGLSVTGVDLSPRMVETATKLFPLSRFVAADFLALPNKPDSVAGILAWYCVVHLTPDQLAPAFAEWHRVLRPGGVLSVSFHVGTEAIRADGFLGTTASLDFTFFDPARVEAELRTVGFEVTESRVREPYPPEYPSRRCYILARKG